LQAAGRQIINVFGIGLKFELRSACQALLFALIAFLVFVID
jgi:hypothetical protein